MFNWLKRLFGRGEATPNSAQEPAPNTDPSTTDAEAAQTAQETESSAAPAADPSPPPIPPLLPIPVWIESKDKKSEEEMGTQEAALGSNSVTNCDAHAKAAFHFAMSLDDPKRTDLEDLSNKYTKPIRDRLSIEEIAHYEAIGEVKAQIDEIEPQITDLEGKLNRSTVAEENDWEIELGGLRQSKEDIILAITKKRDELAERRGDLPISAIDQHFTELDQILEKAKKSNSKFNELSKEAQEQQIERWNERRKFLNTKLTQLGERQSEVAQQIKEEGLIMGRHRNNKVTLASLIASIMGWCVSILTGRTGFDDNMFFEEIIKNVVFSANEFVGSKGFEWRILLFLGLVLIYAFMVAILFGLHRLMGKWGILPDGEKMPKKQDEKTNMQEQVEEEDSSSSQNSSKKATRGPLKVEDPDSDLPLDPDKSQFSSGFGGALVYGLAPLWLIGSAVLAFSAMVAPDKAGENHLGQGLLDSETSYSGFVIGFAIAWLLGYAGYTFIYSKRRGNGHPLAWLGAILLATITTYGLSWLLDTTPSKGETARVAFAICGGMIVLCIGLIGKVLREYFLVSEERHLTNMKEEVSRRLANFSSPWATHLEFALSDWLRTKTWLIARDFGRRQSGQTESLTAQNLRLQGNQQNVFLQEILAEYRDSDFQYFIKTVTNIETLKRQLFHIEAGISNFERLIFEARSGKLKWQDSLNDQIKSLLYRRQVLYDEIIKRESNWTSKLHNWNQYLLQVESCLARGFENGVWYKKNQDKIQFP